MKGNGTGTGGLLTYHLDKSGQDGQGIGVVAILLLHVHAIAQVSPPLAVQHGN